METYKISDCDVDRCGLCHAEVCAFDDSRKYLECKKCATLPRYHIACIYKQRMARKLRHPQCPQCDELMHPTSCITCDYFCPGSDSELKTPESEKEEAAAPPLSPRIVERKRMQAIKIAVLNSQLCIKDHRKCVLLRRMLYLAPVIFAMASLAIVGWAYPKQSILDLMGVHGTVLLSDWTVASIIMRTIFYGVLLIALFAIVVSNVMLVREILHFDNYMPRIISGRARDLETWTNRVKRCYILIVFTLVALCVTTRIEDNSVVWMLFAIVYIVHFVVTVWEAAKANKFATSENEELKWRLSAWWHAYAFDSDIENDALLKRIKAIQDEISSSGASRDKEALADRNLLNLNAELLEKQKLLNERLDERRNKMYTSSYALDRYDADGLVDLDDSFV